MKKIVLFLGILFCVQTNAQSSKREEGIVIGVKGGLNMSNFMGDIKDQSMRTSVHLGLLAEIIVSDNFSVQPELLYSGQGSSDYSKPGFSRIKLDYITLPVLGKFGLTDKLSFEAGPQLGFLVSAKNKTEEENKKLDKVKTLDFDLSAGLEYELSNGVIFQGRYNIGLTDTGLTGDSNKRASNWVIQFSVGYIF
ncbi:MAG: porin family protein [Flavobacterium sp.]|jgi:hypothetical protein